MTSLPGPNPGYPFALQLPAFASVRLRAFGRAGEPLPPGTGFVVTGDAGEPYLITSRKIVTGREWGTGQAATGYVTEPAALIADFQQVGEPNGWRPVVLPLADERGQPLWREHPEHGHEVDVAALPLRFDPVAECVDLVTYDRHFETARLDIASELFVIGFPSSYNPQLVFTMLGIWMRGTIAWPPERDWHGLPCTLLGKYSEVP